MPQLRPTLLALTLLTTSALAQSGPKDPPPEIVLKAAAAKTPTAPGPVQPTWDSIRQNYTVPAWFIDAKFGITMHWGLFSVPAYHNEWYEKYMYSTFSDWHTQNFGAPDKFGYKDFIPLFTAKAFNADELVAIIKDSGAKYFVPTVEHHDGFSLWNSKTNPWNSFAMGPHRDFTNEMAIASRKAGLKFGVCSHNIEHYTFVNPKPGLKTDLEEGNNDSFYWTKHNDARLQQFLEDWVAKNDELIDQYQPDLIWYDNGINGREFDPLKLKVAAYYFNRAKVWGKPVTFQTKGTAMLAGSVLEFEKLNPRGPTQILPGIWDAEEPIGSTWGYSAANPVETFRGAGSVISELATILSMNGNLLLNLSPDQQGAINAAQRKTLHEVGQWLAINGEAVYGTHNYLVDGEGFTRQPPRAARMRTAAATAAAALEEGAKAIAAPEAKPTAPATPSTASASASGSTPPSSRAPSTAPSAMGGSTSAVPVSAAPGATASGKPTAYRFTAKGNALYAIAQSWPGETATLTTFAQHSDMPSAGTVTAVTLLGSPTPLKFTQDSTGLHITMPPRPPNTDYAWTLKILGPPVNPAGPPIPSTMADLK